MDQSTHIEQPRAETRECASAHSEPCCDVSSSFIVAGEVREYLPLAGDDLSKAERRKHEPTIPPGAGQVLDMVGRLSALNSDELDAMDYLLAKLEAGRAKHGPLDLDSDTRDWDAEIGAELADREHYKAFARIQQRRRAVR